MKRIVTALGKLDSRRRAGTVFALCAATVIALPAQTFTTLLSFDHTDGAHPFAGLIQCTDGNLYGTTVDAGSLTEFGAAGTVFKITQSGTLTTLYSFLCQGTCPGPDGSQPFGGLLQATNGDFYGTTNGGDGGTIFKITPSGMLTTLHRFCAQSGCPDGENPLAGLVQATNGDFYGTTYEGGANGVGTIFKITASGALTVLYSFCAQSGCPDGENPSAGLVQATDGDFYGTTEQGGARGAGTIFKITPSGTLTTLYSFCLQTGCPDGSGPKAMLVQASDGNFYGTTYFGGVTGGGTVFKITPSGRLTTLYSFPCSVGRKCPDGFDSVAGLVQATNGDFYGTTSNGGASDSCDPAPDAIPGGGTVFSLSVGLGPFVETQTTSGKVGTVVKILGSDLTGSTSVSFNGTAAIFNVSARSLITTVVPAGATSGRVQVVTPSGTLSSNVPFRVLP